MSLVYDLHDVGYAPLDLLLAPEERDPNGRAPKPARTKYMDACLDAARERQKDAFRELALIRVRMTWLLERATQLALSTIPGGLTRSERAMLSAQFAAETRELVTRLPPLERSLRRLTAYLTDNARDARLPGNVWEVDHWVQGMRVGEWAHNTVDHTSTPKERGGEPLTLRIPFWCDAPWFRCPVYELDDGSYMDPFSPGHDIVLHYGHDLSSLPPAVVITRPVVPDTTPPAADSPLPVADESDDDSIARASSPPQPSAVPLPPPALAAPSIPVPAYNPYSAVPPVASNAKPWGANIPEGWPSIDAPIAPRAEDGAPPIRTFMDTLPERKAQLADARRTRAYEKAERKRRVDAARTDAERMATQVYNQAKHRSQLRQNIWKGELKRFAAALHSSPDMRDRTYPTWRDYVDKFDIEEEPKFPNGKTTWGAFSNPPKDHHLWVAPLVKEDVEGIIKLHREVLLRTAQEQGHPEDLMEQPNDDDDDIL
ncbi:hypothetical protein CALVIDRAFT_563816 [Calocera viscosa TUFC12733]|uniref:Uncharacterized protein n=1 Tax=Calocera viscosa (strain TUFC12733) TaxID=1330018 RepID=A0A167MIJ2_CALVF|nr:hypothetical protein CALVIDRAFT_563816 [Calocera viscosa TUFC12733]